MKRIIFLLLIAFNFELLGQTYISDDGTSAPKWRIGNDRYIELYSDDDSNFVQVKINGFETRLATQDWILSKTRADSVRHAYNLMGGTANRIPVQVSTDSTSFIAAPTNNRFLFYYNGWQWKWAWSPDSTTVVRTSRILTTAAPLRIDGSASADLSANRTLSILYNTTNLQLTSNYLNTIQDIATTSSPTFAQIYLSNAATTTSNAVRADRNISTSIPLSGGGNLTADRTLVLNYNSTNFKLTSNQLNTIQDIATTSSPNFYDLSLTNNFSIGGYVNSNLIPNYTDTYDLGSSTKLWRKGWLSEMEAILFAKNTITLLGGWFYVTKNAGTLVNDINNSQTQIDFGTTLTVNDFIVFRNPGIVEYMQIVSSAGGTTYNVQRNKDGSGANSFAAGTPFAVLGYNGDGRIEFNAYDTPRISILKQGTTYNAQTELIRIGDLNGMPGYSSQTFGACFGDASSYFKYDQSNGAAIRGALYLSNGDNVSTVLSSKASQTDLNTLSGTVSTHTTQIAQNTSDITLKASQTDLNTLTGRMTTAESNITINANSITSEVTERGDADDILQTQIGQNASNILLKVSKNDVINQINISTEGIYIAGSRVQINGSTTFAGGYDPSTKTTSSEVTTIVGNTVTTSYLNAKAITALGEVTAGTFYLSSGKFSVDASGLLTTTSARIANWYVRDGIITDNATSGSEKVVLNQGQKSIYIRPLTGNVKYVMIGQTNNGSSPGWTGNYGISAVDNSNNYLFRLDDAVTAIAGINFDYQRIYNITSSTGFEISRASSKNITTGFAVWDISSSPKMFIGNSTSSMDWNSTTSNTLTIKGVMISSQFSTGADFSETGNLEYVKMQGNQLSAIYSNTGGSFYSGTINPYNIHLSNYSASPYWDFIADGVNREVKIYGKNVPKYWGVIETAPTTYLKGGDYYINSQGQLFMYTGSTWRHYNPD